MFWAEKEPIMTTDGTFRTPIDFFLRIWTIKVRVFDSGKGSWYLTSPLCSWSNLLIGWNSEWLVLSHFVCFPFTDLGLCTNTFWGHTLDRQLEEPEETFAEFDKKCKELHEHAPWRRFCTFLDILASLVSVTWVFLFMSDLFKIEYFCW